MSASSFVRLCLVLVFVKVGFFSIHPPAASSIDAPESAFSAARAIEHVERIAGRPHPIGSPANGEVRQYLLAALEEMGLDPVTQTVSVASYYAPGGPVDVVNVYATVPGTASTGTMALLAHYDTTPATAGANDNSSGVATLLEAARAILAGPRLRNDVMVLFPDGEEPEPRFGSSAFVDDNPASEDIALVVNFEAAGNSGPSMLVETSGPESAMVAQFAAAVPNPVAFSFVGETMNVVGDVGTDLDPFRDAGVPGFHLAYMRGSPIYHTPADDLNSVSLDSLQHHGSNAVGLVRRFGDLDLEAAPEGGNAVYFTLRPFFVQYPTWVSATAALIAAITLAGGITRSMDRDQSSMTAGARATGWALGSTLVVVLTTTAAWMIITSIRSRPSVLESYLYALCLTGLGAAALAKLNGLRSGTLSESHVGFSIVWVVLGLLTSFVAPGFSYLFVWPALAAAVSVRLRATEPGWMTPLRFTSVAAPTVILLIPAIEFFFQFGQPRPGNPDSSIPAVAAIAFLLTTLAAGLVQESSPVTWCVRRRRYMARVVGLRSPRSQALARFLAPDGSRPR